MSEGSQRLGAFLAAKRAALDPAALGIAAASQRRRVAGLRREEVAQRARISADYYTRLEQGRVSAPSLTVLAALISALDLDQAEADYMRDLVHQSVGTRSPGDTQQVPERMLRLIADLGTIPALVISPTMHILAWNRQAAALFLDFASVPEPKRNLARLIYLDPRLRGRFVDWEEVARAIAAILRTGAAGDPANSELSDLLDELIANDEGFALAWRQHGVERRPRSRSPYLHPIVGSMILDWQLLASVESPELLIAAVSPGDDDSSAAAFRALTELSLTAGCSEDATTATPPLGDTV